MSQANQQFEPFYDVNRTYDDNYAQGPFGAFADALRAPDSAESVVADGDGAASAAARSAVASVDTAAADGVAASTARPRESFLGFSVDLPFGIPAGPLLNERFTTAAFRMGFDLAVYKTVRSRAWGCNPFPNVLAVHPRSADGALTPGSPELDEGVLADTRYDSPISISNSFGVPSRDPDVWQPDMRAAIAAAGPGQLLVPSFQGSRVAGMSTDDYIADHVATARLVCETGARLMEMNTSCPNEGHNRLLCHDPHLVARICEAVKGEIGDRPLMIKLAYIPPTATEPHPWSDRSAGAGADPAGRGRERYTYARVVDDAALELMVRETAGRGTVQAIAAINTISARLVDADGNQALPGAGRERSGVCGNAIRHAGLDMVARLAAIRERLGLDFAIVGVGGVVAPADYAAYRAAGADAVMSATGAMWDAHLARRIKAADIQ